MSEKHTIYYQIPNTHNIIKIPNTLYIIKIQNTLYIIKIQNTKYSDSKRIILTNSKHNIIKIPTLNIIKFQTHIILSKSKHTQYYQSPNTHNNIKIVQKHPIYIQYILSTHNVFPVSTKHRSSGGVGAPSLGFFFLKHRFPLWGGGGGAGGGCLVL